MTKSNPNQPQQASQRQHEAQDQQILAQAGSVTGHIDPRHIKGHLHFPSTWTLFANPVHPNEQIDPLYEGYLRVDQTLIDALETPDRDPQPQQFQTIPDTLIIHSQPCQPVTVEALNHQIDLRPILGHRAYNQGQAANTDRGSDQTTRGQVAYLFVPLHASQSGSVTLGFGADSWLKVWVNGKEVFSRMERNKPMPQPVSYFNQRVDVSLNQGQNILAVRMVAGRFGAILAMAGPDELRKGKVNSLQDDPILRGDEDWTSPLLAAKACEQASIDIADQLEPFVDSYLIDTMQGDMQHRLHHPQPREIVLDAQEPWENQIGYAKILEHQGKVMLYYRHQRQKDHPDDKALESTLLAISDDGIHFTRPKLNHLQISGHAVNNAVIKGRPAHNFAPFVDTNPAAPAHQKFKAVGYHPQGSGIAAYASPDGMVWEQMSEDRIIDYHFGGFDSQNIAFWDTTRGCYFCYFRGATDMWHARVRSIAVATSHDMIHWTNHRDLTYDDTHLWDLYINAIAPYARAPHLFIGTPARFMPYRKKIDSHGETGVSDALLMSSRDAVHFHRWQEAFIRPTSDPMTWTDRNQFPAPGFVQTGPAEMSVYWTEHNRQATCRIRRGVLRLDGFASLHAGGNVGEVLTKPLEFKGKCLVLNHATSAAGSIRCELCDEHGQPLPGYTLAQSDVLFGNAIEEMVSWQGSSDVASLSGRPVRLRMRMQDADVYAMRFTNALPASHA